VLARHYRANPITKGPARRDKPQRTTVEIREVARRQGMKTLREAGLLKAIEGITTVAEVLRATAE